MTDSLEERRAAAADNAKHMSAGDLAENLWVLTNYLTEENRHIMDAALVREASYRLNPTLRP